MKILAISGSLRADSHNSKLLRAAAELLPDGVELELWDGLKEVPPYDEDDDVTPAPAAVARLREAIAGADALLIATPEYNSSIPGQLKNALDWASRPLATNALRNKPVAVMGASTSMFGAVWAQAELRKVLGATGARVLDAELAVPQAHDRFDEDDRLRDDELRSRLAEIAAMLVAETRGGATQGGATQGGATQGGATQPSTPARPPLARAA
jgi:chromate reductase, NAD(P)H dehydrogenase (quinone)